MRGKRMPGVVKIRREGVANKWEVDAASDQMTKFTKNETLIIAYHTNFGRVTEAHLYEGRSLLYPTENITGRDRDKSQSVIQWLRGAL